MLNMICENKFKYRIVKKKSDIMMTCQQIFFLHINTIEFKLNYDIHYYDDCAYHQANTLLLLLLLCVKFEF